jgi:protein CpxP
MSDSRTHLAAMRPVAFAALMGVACFAGQLTQAHAETRLAQAVQAKPATADGSSDKGETVEQRISHLHASLKITPAEEPAWTAVAQAMRDNSVTMEKLIAKRTPASPAMTAVDDLKTYQAFTQAHVDNLKTLIPAFQTLYDSMPDAQKKEADQVFAKFGRHRSAAHGQQG